MKKRKQSNVILKVIILILSLSIISICLTCWLMDNLKAVDLSEKRVEFVELKQYKINDKDKSSIIRIFKEVEEENEKGWKTVLGNIDNDSEPDKIMERKNNIKILITSENIAKRTSFLGKSWISSIGIDDIDNDGNQDAWYYDNDDDYLMIYFGDGTGKLFNNSKSMPRDIYLSYILFYDIDKDGRVELINFSDPEDCIKVFDIINIKSER